MAAARRPTAAERAKAELQTLDVFLREYGIERTRRESTSSVARRALIDYQQRIDELTRELHNAKIQIARYVADRELVSGPVAPEEAPDERTRSLIQTYHAFGYAVTDLTMGDVNVKLHPRHLDKPRDPDPTFDSADEDD
jgi:hypothetical protein